MVLTVGLTLLVPLVDLLSNGHLKKTTAFMESVSEKVEPFINITGGMLGILATIEGVITGEIREDTLLGRWGVIIFAIMMILLCVFLMVDGGKSAIQSLDKAVKDKSKSSVKPEEHLIMQLLQKKMNREHIAYISLCLSLAGELVLYKTIPTQEISIRRIIILTVFLLLGSFIKQRILKYRFEHGLYGTSYSEAKEIIAFILEWYRENGDSNSKPPKLVFTQEEIDQCLQVNGGEEYAG